MPPKEQSHRQMYPTLTFEFHPPPLASSTVIRQPANPTHWLRPAPVRDATKVYLYIIASPGEYHHQITCKTQLLSPALSSLLSMLDANELDNAPEFYQYINVHSAAVDMRSADGRQKTGGHIHLGWIVCEKRYGMYSIITDDG